MMGGIGGSGTLAIAALRGGQCNEIIIFLTDLQSAYNSLYSFFWSEFAFVERQIHLRDLSRNETPPEFQERNRLISFGYFELLLDKAGLEHKISNEYISPKYQLEISRISVKSPGFWEVVGGLNPIQQLRGYLDERHKRRQDVEYRELAEKERLQLELELLELTVEKTHIDVTKSKLDAMREYKVDEEAIKQIAWQRLGPPLAALGRHQDRKLIGGPLPDDGGLRTPKIPHRKRR